MLCCLLLMQLVVVAIGMVKQWHLFWVEAT